MSGPRELGKRISGGLRTLFDEQALTRTEFEQRYHLYIGYTALTGMKTFLSSIMAETSYFRMTEKGNKKAQLERLSKLYRILEVQEGDEMVGWAQSLAHEYGEHFVFPPEDDLPLVLTLSQEQKLDGLQVKDARLVGHLVSRLGVVNGKGSLDERVALLDDGGRDLVMSVVDGLYTRFYEGK